MEFVALFCVFIIEFTAAREAKGYNGLAAMLAEQGGLVAMVPRIIGGILIDCRMQSE